MTGRDRYPENWPELARQCKERAGWKCQRCGIEQHTLAQSRAGNPYIIYLHAAHVHHDPGNQQPELLCLCISCHAAYDYQRKQREKRIMVERLKHLKLLIAEGVVSVSYSER